MIPSVLLAGSFKLRSLKLSQSYSKNFYLDIWIFFLNHPHKKRVFHNVSLTNLENVLQIKLITNRARECMFIRVSGCKNFENVSAWCHPPSWVWCVYQSAQKKLWICHCYSTALGETLHTCLLSLGMAWHAPPCPTKSCSLWCFLSLETIFMSNTQHSDWFFCSWIQIIKDKSCNLSGQKHINLQLEFLYFELGENLFNLVVPPLPPPQQVQALQGMPEHIQLSLTGFLSLETIHL